MKAPFEPTRARGAALALALALLALGCATTPGAPPPPAAPEVRPAPPPVEAPAKPEAPTVEPAPAYELSTPALDRPVPPRPLASSPGMEVVRLPSDKPVVSLRLVFRAGSIDDPAGKEGLTALTATVMAEGGTRKLSSAQLLRALYPMAAELSVGADKHQTVFSGRVHRDKLDGFLDLFSQVLLSPRFDAGEFERLRTDALNTLRTRLRGEDDERLGQVALDALLYEGHPYRHFVGGTVKGLSALTIEDLRAHAARVFTRDRLTIGIAGPVDDALVARVTERLSGLPAEGAPRVELPAAPGVHGRALILRKDALSTAVSMGYVYPLRRGDPDYYPVALALSHLGEHRQSSGVLFTELREHRGLNYGTYAYPEHFIQEGWGTFPRTNVARAAQELSLWIRPVEPGHAVFATRGAVYFLHQLVQEGISPEAFERTRGFLDGYTRLWEQSDQRRLGYAIDDRLYGTRDFLGGFREAMARMTPEDVTSAVRRHLRPDRLNFVFVASDAEGLAELLREQPATPIEYATPKSAEVMAEDANIASLPLPIRRDAVRIVEAATFMEE